MKTLLRFATAGALVAGLSACASTSQLASATPASGAYRAPDHLVSDSEYIAQVERLARIRGVQVQWVNPPVKRVAGTPQ